MTNSRPPLTGQDGDRRPTFTGRDAAGAGALLLLVGFFVGFFLGIRVVANRFRGI
jgi:hypothetical protein